MPEATYSVPPADPIEPTELWAAMNELLDALIETNPELQATDQVEADEALEGTIQVLGPTPTLIRVHVEMPFGRRLARAYGLIAADGGPRRADALDAFSEFVNLVGGAVKLLVDDETGLGLPTVGAIALGAAGGDDFTLVEHTVAVLAVRCEGPTVQPPTCPGVRPG